MTQWLEELWTDVRFAWRQLRGAPGFAIVAVLTREPPPLTEVQTAGVKRVKEMIEVLNTGDYAKMRSYFDAQSDPNGFVNALGRYHLSRGYDLLRVELVPNRGDLAAGIVRNRITGDEEYLAVRIEPQPPHRIILFQARVADEVAASWKLKLVTSTAVTEKDRLEEIGTYLKRLGDADLFSGAVVIARGDGDGRVRAVGGGPVGGEVPGRQERLGRHPLSRTDRGDGDSPCSSRWQPATQRS